MGRNVDDIIKSLPPARRVRVEAVAQRMAREMIQHAASLEQLRKAAGKTQADVAEKLGIRQHAVSQLERRADLYLSTLSKYVGALGHRLELSLVTSTGERVQLANLRPWDQQPEARAASKSNPKKTVALVSKESAPKGKLKPERAAAVGGDASTVRRPRRAKKLPQGGRKST